MGAEADVRCSDSMGDTRTLESQREDNGEPYNGVCSDGYYLTSIPCETLKREAGNSRSNPWIGNSSDACDYMLGKTEKYCAGMAVYWMSRPLKKAEAERLTKWATKYETAKNEFEQAQRTAKSDAVKAAIARAQKKKVVKCPGTCGDPWPSKYVQQLIVTSGKCPYRNCNGVYAVTIKCAKLTKARKSFESAKEGLTKVYASLDAAGVRHGCMGAGWGPC